MRKSALWIFALLLLMRTAMSVNIIFNGREVAMKADGIPLDTYPPAAAQTIVSMFALLALANLIVTLAGWVVLIRYRTFVPFMFALLLLQHVLGRAILYFHPIPRSGSPPAAAINLTLLAVMVIGLALSLLARRRGGRGD